jgi:ADP-heptose:LPS heptosyltransferase
LIAGLGIAHLTIGSDGGAMHVAAAYRHPIVCMFGSSDPATWHPWGVPHEVLRPASREVADLGVGEVLAAVQRLQAGAHMMTASGP